MAKDGCWVEVFEHTNFTRGQLRIDGPAEYRKLDDLRLSNGKSAGNEIDSLRTGPDTWLEIYKHEDFEGNLHFIGPNTEIPNLDEKYSIGDNIDSLALFDEEPEWWRGAWGVKTRRVEPGEWRTLETTFNAPCVACFMAPAGARIRRSHWLFSTQEHELDGHSIKCIQIKVGKVQVLVNEPGYIRYSWNGTSGAPYDLIWIPL